jgi:hypothetical protein
MFIKAQTYVKDEPRVDSGTPEMVLPQQHDIAKLNLVVTKPTLTGGTPVWNADAGDKIIDTIQLQMGEDTLIDVPFEFLTKMNQVLKGVEPTDGDGIIDFQLHPNMMNSLLPVRTYTQTRNLKLRFSSDAQVLANATGSPTAVTAATGSVKLNVEYRKIINGLPDRSIDKDALTGGTGPDGKVTPLQNMLRTWLIWKKKYFATAAEQANEADLNIAEPGTNKMLRRLWIFASSVISATNVRMLSESAITNLKIKASDVQIFDQSWTQIKEANKQAFGVALPTGVICIDFCNQPINVDVPNLAAALPLGDHTDIRLIPTTAGTPYFEFVKEIVQPIRYV